MIMGTLKGFPNPPALWLRRAKPAFAYAIMGTLKGFAPPFGPPRPTPAPLAALGLANPSRALAPGLAAAAAAASPWAEPAFAYAIMGTLKGFAPPFGPHPKSPRGRRAPHETSEPGQTSSALS
jgi:hypothetical protein